MTDSTALAPLERVRAAMRTTLKLSENDAAAITRESTPVSVSGWTSLAHVQLILELEQTFDVMFEGDEIASLASVAAILDALDRRNVR